MMTEKELYDFFGEEAKIIVIDNEKTDYAILKSGKVYSFKRHKFLSRQRASAVIRTKDNVTQIQISHLVAKYFNLPNPKPEVFDIIKHKDGDEFNSAFDNLEWTDRFGLDNPLTRRAKYTQDERLQIIDDIKKSDLRASEIAHKYDIKINAGNVARLCRKNGRGDKVQKRSDKVTDKIRKEICDRIDNRDKKISEWRFMEQLAVETGYSASTIYRIYRKG